MSGSPTALASIDDPDTRAAALAERTLLAVLEAGCSAPVAALATVHGGPAHPGRIRDLGRRDREIRSRVTGVVGDATGVGAALASTS